jgi:hypothetical protein
MITRRLFPGAALCALAFAVAGCGDSTGTPAPAPAAVRIEMIEPAASLLVGPVRVRASCFGGCRSLEAFVRGNGTETRIASGTDSVSVVYPVADLGIPTVRLVFRATDSAGTVTSLETPELGVALGPWTRVYAVDGTLLDATPDRALYIDANRGLRMLAVHSGWNPELMSLVRTGLTRGFVNDSGAVADLGPPGVGSTGNAPWGIWEWGGSTLTGGRYGGSPRGLGRWAHGPCRANSSGRTASAATTCSTVTTCCGARSSALPTRYPSNPSTWRRMGRSRSRRGPAWSRPCPRSSSSGAAATRRS